MLALVKIEKCSKCESIDIVKNGFTRYGNQRIKCKGCNSSPVLHRKKDLAIDINCVIRSFLERLSLCGVARVFAISYYQVYYQLNVTCLLLPDFKTQLAACNVNDILELDELCGFCQRKANKQWLWAVLSRHTRQIVAYVIGDRSEKTFRRLVRKIPVEYLRCQSYSDLWKSYNILCSKGNHKQVGKEEGQTNHIERYWATLRARISRYVRRSLSFSRKLKYHHLVTKLFIINYNQQCINTF